MIQAISPDFLSHRKAELQQQISHEFELKNYEHLSLLEIKWVHRYGLNELPKPLNISSELDSSTNDIDRSNQVSVEEEIESFNCSKKQKLEDSSQTTFEFSNLKTSDCDKEFESQEFQNSSDTAFEDLVDVIPEKINHNDSLEPLTLGKSKIQVLPPPPPTLNKFRRWLPRLEEEMPNAS